jgi:thymidylate synthase (FAD)
MYGKNIMDLQKHHYNILDSGYLTLIDVMGTDKDIARSARVSYNNHESQKTDEDDKRLINYLMKNHHSSPFEMCELKFQVKCPIFVARQWMRHRTWSFNEISGRYTEFDDEFYSPLQSRVKAQSETNKQCSGQDLGEHIQDKVCNIINQTTDDSFEAYKKAIELKCARELSRIVLPLNTYTTFIAKVDLSNLLKFIQLRDHPHAQWEIQEYARALGKIVQDLFPWTWNAFDNYVLGARTVSRYDLENLKKQINSIEYSFYNDKLESSYFNNQSEIEENYQQNCVDIVNDIKKLLGV